MEEEPERLSPKEEAADAVSNESSTERAPEEGEEEVEEEEEEAEGLSEEEEEEEPYHNPDDFISQPYLGRKGTLPEKIVEFDYSYGYDCKRHFNLCVVDKVILIYASGNIIHFLNAVTGEKKYRRCSSGRGIGHITTNPVLPHVAVGEKGDNPHIIIYEWPTFEIVTVLKKGSKRGYSHLNFSPDGELLCSQGIEPDFTLTVWNWRKHRIMLRAKAYAADVFNARFSLYVPGHLTTSGTSHIKFWKINRTFTGLKLQGELGRFGKTEICNIVGFLALPDEKVVSGCEWGNILVWDAGLIRVEVFRRGKNFCHEAPITQFIYNNGELMTVAMDGTIKIWYYETIELADPPEDDRYIEVEPIFEFEIGDYYHKAELMVIVKSDPDPADFIWFGQDGNGGIWKLDLSTSLNSEPPQLIYQCHAGEVVAIQVSPASHHFATLGKDGRLFIYDYKDNHLVAKKEFLTGGTCLLWLPLSIESSGCVILGGFMDGVIRVICFSMHELAAKVPSPTDEYVNLIQVSKPHTKPITVITANPEGTVVVTGSEDATVFVYQIARTDRQFVELIPIGFIPVDGGVMCCCWKPGTLATLLVGCNNGVFAEFELPQEPPEGDPVSYIIRDINFVQSRFVSVKGEIRRNQRIREIIEERKMQEAMKREEEAEDDDDDPVERPQPVSAPPVEEEEDEAIEEIDESELPEAFVPPEPNPILVALYSPSGNVWLSMGGFDAGYIYEYDFHTEGPLMSTMVDDADDIEIHSYHYYYNMEYLVLGMHDGKIRIVRVNEEDANDFSDYWTLAMHDNDNGIIYQICFSYNYKYMFTCGSDGNVFSYTFHPESQEYKHYAMDRAQRKGFPANVCSDIDDSNAMSLEQKKIKADREVQMKNANAHKRDILDALKALEKRYDAVLRRNAKLPKSQQLSKEELILDSRVAEDLEMSLFEEMDLVKRKLLYNMEKSRCQYAKLREYYVNPVEIHKLRVYGIDKKEEYVETFRLRTLGPDFAATLELAAIKREEEELKGRAQARLFSEEEIIEVITRRPNPAEALMKQIMALCGDYKKNIKLRRLLRKYRQRKEQLETRRIEWHEMMRKKPNPDTPDPEDVEAIKAAREFIGDYKLKTAPDYKGPVGERVTTVSMYHKLLKTREAIYQAKKDYNLGVLELRDRKQELIEKHKQLRVTLLDIAKEIPKDRIRDPPDLPTCDENVEFPEKKMEYTEQDVFEELPKRYKNMYRSLMVKKKELRTLDKEYEMLISERKAQKVGKIESKFHLMRHAEIIGSGTVKELEAAGGDDQVTTPWEKEYRKLRVAKRLYEQDAIIEEMENDIKKYDEDLYAIKVARYRVEVDVKFLELYLLTVHQEVLILKKFEAAEEQKENKLFEKLLEKHEIQKKMNEINARIEGRNREIRRTEEEIKNLVTTYYAAIADNKFYDFLRRIFKKKYRPPKTKTDDSDSESESSSSSSSSEEDAKSLDSKDLGPLRLDESVCPPGCDQQLYEWTFTQRSARHTMELAISEEKRLIEVHRKDTDQLTKKMKMVEAQYKECQEDLMEYLREKQRNLNEVETVVVLHLNQIQNLKSEKELEKLSDSVVFSAKQLTNLYKRVGELEKETQIEKQKHAKNCQHLARMKIDINHMRDVIQKLNKKIEETMLHKFGTKIDVDDIEESLLKRLVADMHSIVLELERKFEAKLGVLRRKLREREDACLYKVFENTERNNLLTVLEEEKTNLQKEYARQKKLICSEVEVDDAEDIAKLEKIIKGQEERIACLRLEIHSLKVKAKPMPPIIGIYESEVEEVVQRFVMMSLEGECDEITEEARNDLRDIYDEAQEIVLDMKDGVADSEDIDRIRKLTEEFIEKLPVKVRTSVVQKLAGKAALPPDKTAEQCRDPSIMLREIVRALPAEYFLEIMEMVGEIMEGISSTIEGGAKTTQILLDP